MRLGAVGGEVFAESKNLRVDSGLKPGVYVINN